MIYWLIAYAIGYLISVIILTLYKKLDDWESYVARGFVAFFWPLFVILGVLGYIPWLIHKIRIK